MLRRVLPIVVLLSLGLPATAAAPSRAHRCAKIFETLRPYLLRKWRATPPEQRRVAMAHLAELKTRFVARCRKLPEKALACGEGRGNEYSRHACDHTPESLRAECLRHQRADLKNPLKCYRIERAMRAAGTAWNEEVLARDPAFRAASAKQRGGAWSDPANQTYMKHCTATGHAKAYCQCMLGLLWEHLTPKDGDDLAAALVAKTALPPSVKKGIDWAAGHCGRNQ